MGYYLELRPRDAHLIPMSVYRGRLAKLPEPHPAAVYPLEDPQVRAKWADTFICPGGFLTVHETRDTPAGVTVTARPSSSFDEASICQVLRDLVEVADKANADVYVEERKIDPRAMNELMKGYRRERKASRKMFGAVGEECKG